MKIFPILKPLTIALMLTTTIAHAEHEFQPVDCPKIQGYDIHSSCDKNTPTIKKLENRSYGIIYHNTTTLLLNLSQTHVILFYAND